MMILPLCPCCADFLLYGKSDVKHKAGVMALQMERCGVVHTARLRGEAGRLWSSEKQPPAALTL